MTLKEIAKQAGVSISTVSRVINQKNTKAASPEVQNRIWEIVRANGYIPNSSARDLKMGVSPSQAAKRPKTVACLFARSATTSTDLFFTEIARAIEQEAFKHNYFLKHSFTGVDLADPAVAARLGDIPVDGAAILGRYDQKILRFFSEHYKYVVYVGLNPIGSQYDQVVCEGAQVAKAAVSYLHSLGHTRIGYIGEVENEIRYTGFGEALKSLGLPFSHKHVANVKVSLEGGYRGANLLMDTGVDITAVFCANDNTALGAVRAFQERGYKIPQDVSVIGVDDIETVQYISPMLTTVHIPLEEMGHLSAKILIDRIEGGHRLPIKVVLPFYIAKRDSCAPPSMHRRAFTQQNDV